MSEPANNNETLGAWVIHHGRKLQSDQHGAAEFSAIDGAAKSGLLLAGMSASEEVQLSSDAVAALAKTTNINPKTELPTYLDLLKRRQLIDVTTAGAVSVLGVSSRKVLQETATIFEGLTPGAEERIVIDVAEQTSQAPRLLVAEQKRLADQFGLRAGDAAELLRRSQEIGFVDSEIDGQDKLLFNGNLFRRGNIVKTRHVVNSLNAAEQERVAQVTALLQSAGCLDRERVRKVLGDQLFEKLHSAGFYDVNTVSNDSGEHAFVTAPSAFHKFVDPMVDDAFDLAKALVAALTYGIAKSSASRGRIHSPSLLLGKLVSGREIGPTTAIGQDYRVLEMRRVIKTRHAEKGMYFMRLLKKDIGQIAQQVLTQGGATDQVLGAFPTASMTSYAGPEETRMDFRRKKQSQPSRRHTGDILQTLREQGTTW
jgi:hypothetical protein